MFNNMLKYKYDRRHVLHFYIHMFAFEKNEKRKLYICYINIDFIYIFFE